MGDEASKVTCPHCGAGNPKSLLVTTCGKCLGSLEAAPPASEEAAASVPPTAEEAVAQSSAEVGKDGSPSAAPPALSDEGSLDDVCSELLPFAVLLGFTLVLLALGSGKWWLLAIVGATVVVGAGGLMVARAMALASTYEVTADPSPDPVPLGSSVTWGVVAKARKRFDLGPGRVGVRCQEYMVRVARSGSRAYRETICEESRPFAGRHLEAGETAELRARLSVPASAVPSYRGTHNRIEWILFVEAAVPGICPNVKERAQLAVLPWIAAAGDPVPDQAELVLAKWLEKAVGEVEPAAAREGPLLAQLSADDGDQSDAAPAVSVGSSRQLNLTLETTEDIDCRAIRCRVCCRTHGRGDSDEIGVAAPGKPIHEGALAAGQTVRCPVAVSIPDEGPVSYRGHHVNFGWLVQVNVDMPGWSDKHVDVPFVVTPRLGPKR